MSTQTEDIEMINSPQRSFQATLNTEIALTREEDASSERELLLRVGSTLVKCLLSRKSLELISEGFDYPYTNVTVVHDTVLVRDGDEHTSHFTEKVSFNLRWKEKTLEVEIYLSQISLSKLVTELFRIE